MTTTTEQKKRLVRPRWVWAGLIVALVGAAVLGTGVGITSWPWSIVGAVLLAAGAVTSVWGGVMNDVKRQPVGKEFQQALHGEQHEGHAPSDQLRDPRAQEISRELDRERETLIRATHDAPRPPLAPLGGMVLVLVAVFLLAAQWSVYPSGATAQSNANRALGVGMVAGAAGLRILVGRPGAHRIATALALLAGIALVANAFLAGHEIAATALAEGVSGVLVILAAGLAIASPLPSEPLDARPRT